jgi:hypothetical protein
MASMVYGSALTYLQRSRRHRYHDKILAFWLALGIISSFGVAGCGVPFGLVVSGFVPWTVLVGQLLSMLLCCGILRRDFQLSYDDSTSSQSCNSNSENASGKMEVGGRYAGFYKAHSHRFANKWLV